MYSRYAEGQGWKTELLSASYTDIGGFKEIIFLIEGRGAYSMLKYESGVHRVQRIPSTESGAVFILPRQQWLSCLRQKMWTLILIPMTSG
jgi:protein subunit release factor A